MNRALKFLIVVAGMTLLLPGCKKEPGHKTDHPNHGKITLTTDWSDRTDGITPPTGYTVQSGEFSATVSGEKNTLDNLFEPGTHRIVVHHAADNIAVSGTTVSVGSASGGAGRAGGDEINAMPGWFFSCAMDAEIEKDKVHELTAVMRQQVRELTLTIEPTGGTVDNVESITATLTGVAGTLDIDTDTHGTPSDITLTFTKGADGKWSATVRLLGVAGTVQKLTGTISFTGGSPADITLESDLSAKLADFNTGKKTPLELGGEVAETPTGAGFTATITGWTVNDKGNVIAN